MYLVLHFLLKVFITWLNTIWETQILTARCLSNWRGRMDRAVRSPLPSKIQCTRWFIWQKDNYTVLKKKSLFKKTTFIFHIQTWDIEKMLIWRQLGLWQSWWPFLWRLEMWRQWNFSTRKRAAFSSHGGLGLMISTSCPFPLCPVN